MHPPATATLAAPPPGPPRLRRVLTCWLLLTAFLGAFASPSHAFAAPTTSAPESALWQWPAHPRPQVLRPFDLTHRYGAGHRGVDLQVAPGSPVTAVAAGTVHFVGRVVDRNVVSIQHPNGLRSTYEPVDAVVHAGESVTAGALIGTVSTTTLHAPDGGLHLGARLGDDYVDPLSLLQPLPPAILLPLHP